MPERELRWLGVSATESSRKSGVARPYAVVQKRGVPIAVPAISDCPGRVHLAAVVVALPVIGDLRFCVVGYTQPPGS